ncbi:MAG: VC0807 family protein [Bacillaceae bacterium]
MKNVVVTDLLFYLALPFLFYKICQGFLGDYYSMLLSTVPGIFYTLYRFWKTRQWNVTGMFILGTLIVSTLTDVLAGNADKMILYSVYYQIGLGIFIFSTGLFKQPLTYHFALDFAVLQGHDREISKKLYKHKTIYKYFRYLLYFFGGKTLLFAGLSYWFYLKYGTKSYFMKNAVFTAGGWIFGIVFAAGFIYIGKKITELIEQQPHIVEK